MEYIFIWPVRCFISHFWSFFCVTITAFQKNPVQRKSVCLSSTQAWAFQALWKSPLPVLPHSISLSPLNRATSSLWKWGADVRKLFAGNWKEPFFPSSEGISLHISQGISKKKKKVIQESPWRCSGQSKGLGSSTQICPELIWLQCCSPFWICCCVEILVCGQVMGGLSEAKGAVWS